jgi:hypothetical protein
MHRDIKELLRLLDEGYDHTTWHGPNLRAAVSGVKARNALRRPGTQRHNIWEVTVHAAYWKYAVRRRLLGEKKRSFPLKGSNWFASPANAGEKEWRGALGLLADEHRKLRAAVARVSPAKLRRKLQKGRWSVAQTISGMAFHDVYHAGQIQLLKKLMRRS